VEMAVAGWVVVGLEVVGMAVAGWAVEDSVVVAEAAEAKVAAVTDMQCSRISLGLGASEMR